ncbi:MAG TPA: MATE family efflux transporter, partial [Puia sp.]|nr:MATE family efflux transporter [Puia sp.]
DAVAAVALTESVLALVYSLAIGLSMAGSAMVARRIGEKNREEASRTAVQAILIALGMTTVISLAGSAFSKDILRWMGGSGEVVETGSVYTRIIFGSSIVIMMLFLVNGIFRGAGNASVAMWSLWIANGFNILLCPVLIHFYGLRGAAIATSIGRGTGVCFQLYHLLNGNSAIRLVRRYFKPDWQIIRNMLRVAWTGTVQFLIGSASWIVMARIIAHFGSEAIAGYQVAIRILIFFLLPAWGMSNAAATLVGQNLGAGQPSRAEESVWTAARYNAAFMIFVSLLFLFASGPIVQFMNPEQGVERIAVETLRIVSMGYIFYGVGMVLINAFNGAGDTRTPTIINLFCFWAFQIPVAYSISIPLGLGPQGVFYAIVTAETAITITAFILFRKGKWKKVKI